MKNLLLFLMMSLPYIVSGQDQINWVPFSCDDNNPINYVAIDNRKVLMKVNASWPANETRPVTKWINDSHAISMGEMAGGEYLLTLEYPDTAIAPIIGYEAIYVVNLQAGEGLHSEDLAIRTEPTPSLFTNMSITETLLGDSVNVRSVSQTIEGSSWGSINPDCSAHQIIMINEIFSGDILVFSDTIVSIPGPSLAFPSNFLYQGTETELCARSRMEKISIGIEPEFSAQTIVFNNGVCQFTGSQTPNDTISWISWDCDDDYQTTYVTTGHHRALMRYHAGWPNTETRPVIQAIFFSDVTDVTYTNLGFISGGDQLLDVDFPTTDTEYWQTHSIALQVASSSDAVTEVKIITTEPAPQISIESVISENVVTLNTTSETTLNTGWGNVVPPMCDYHEIIITTEVVNDDGLVIHEESTVCTPGESTLFTTQFVYEGPREYLCARSIMKRVDMGSPQTFSPRTVVASNEVCFFAGDVTTGKEERNAPDKLTVFPNPCTDVINLRYEGQSRWTITNILSLVTLTGQDKVIDTHSWPSGVYVLILEGTNSITRIVKY